MKNPKSWPLFFSVFENSRKTMAKPFQALWLLGYIIAIITAHAPGQHT